MNHEQKCGKNRTNQRFMEENGRYAPPEELNKTKMTVIERKEEPDLTEEVRNNFFYQQNVISLEEAFIINSKILQLMRKKQR